jgi:hypothetical protein
MHNTKTNVQCPKHLLKVEAVEVEAVVVDQRLDFVDDQSVSTMTVGVLNEFTVQRSWKISAIFTS